MNPNWQQDPLLKQMSPEKLELLNTYASRLGSTPKNQMMNTFLAIQKEAMEKKINFSNSETDLMMKILGSHMNPAEKKRMETLTMLAKRLAAKS